MSMGLNKAYLMGRIGADPDVRTAASGTQVVRVNLATPRPHKEGGTWVESTDWHRLVAFGRSGDYLAKYAHKGDALAVECSIRNNNWADKKGVQHYDTALHVERVLWLSTKRPTAPTGPSTPEVAPLHEDADYEEVEKPEMPEDVLDETS